MLLSFLTVSICSSASSICPRYSSSISFTITLFLPCSAWTPSITTIGHPFPLYCVFILLSSALGLFVKLSLGGSGSGWWWWWGGDSWGSQAPTGEESTRTWRCEMREEEHHCGGGGFPRDTQIDKSEDIFPFLRGRLHLTRSWENADGAHLESLTVGINL